MDNLAAAIIVLGFLAFVGWVFTVTGSGWAFALLLLMPSVNIVTKKKGKKHSKILKDE